MQCRNCGTEIADKAIICFRCGQGTADPVRKPAPAPSGGSRSTALMVAAAVLFLLTVGAVVWSRILGHPWDVTSTVGGGLSAVAAVWLIIRLTRRR